MKRTVAVLCVCLVCGCAEKAETEPYDYCAAGDYQNCNAGRDAGDWIDGTGCENPVTNTDIYLGAIKAENDSTPNGDNLAAGAGSKGNLGYVGEIDGACHTQGIRKSDGAQLYGADLDFIRIETKPGTPLHVEVACALNSMTSPVLYMYDGTGRELVTGRANEGGTAYLDILAPSNPLYVSVEEWKNYKNNRTPSDCSHNYQYDLVGGADYRYVMKVSPMDGQVRDKMNVSHGLLSYDVSSPELIRVNNIHFEHSGQVYYAKFQAETYCDFLVEVTTKNVKNGAVPRVFPIQLVKNDDGVEVQNWVLEDVKVKDRAVYRIYNAIGLEDESKSGVKTYMFAIYDDQWKYDYDLDYMISIDPSACSK
ncbi:MAG: hypothetical protein IJ268_02885 [Proteobacteria bacterium]|nr:hypothetical protein [Pseudomonadota bacterium]